MANLSNINNKFIVEDSGDVGIGVTAATSKLHLRDPGVNSDVGIKIGNDSRDWNLQVMGSVSDSFQIFTHDNSNVMTILPSGNVGIGTPSPSEKLHVNSGTGNVPALFESTDNLSLITFKDNNTTTDVGIGADDNDEVFYAGGSERMRIDSVGLATFRSTYIVAGLYGGEVTLGGSSTTFGLQLKYNQDAATTSTLYHSPGYSSTGNLFKLGSGSGNTNQLVLKGDGNVGIGTDSPSNGKLEVQQTATTAALWVQTGGTTSSYTIADFRTGTNASALEIKGDGTVGINSGAYLGFNGAGDASHSVGYNAGIDGAILRGQNGVILGTGGGATASERMRITSTGFLQVVDGAVTLNKSDGSFITFDYNGSTKGYIGSERQVVTGGSQDNMAFSSLAGLSFATGSSLTKRMSITSGGTTAIFKDAVETNFDALAFLRLHPNATSTNSFTNIFAGVSTSNNYGVAFGGLRTSGGSAPAFSVRTHVDSIIGAEKFRVSHDGDVVISGGGRILSSAGIYLGTNNNSNLLDDYEEGTFTMTMTNDGVGNTVTSRYTKVGRLVFIEAYFSARTISNAGNCRVSGLPFSADASEGYGILTYWHGTAISQNGTVFYVQGTIADGVAPGTTAYAQWVTGTNKAIMLAGFYTTA